MRPVPQLGVFKIINSMFIIAVNMESYTVRGRILLGWKEYRVSLKGESKMSYLHYDCIDPKKL